MIFEVTETVYRMIQSGTEFYTETPDYIECYKLLPSGIALFKYKKSDNPEDDLIWRNEHITKAIPAISVDKGDINLKLVKE